MALTKVSFSMIEGEYTNVLDYGAVGDGSTNDTAAVQSAFDAGGVLYFPPGYTFNCGLLNVNNDLQIIGYDSTLLHRANTAANGVGLIKMLGDNKLVIRGLKIDGNAANQTATYATYNMVWCSIGSMELYECWVGNSKGHAIRTGNIDDFDASKFAHDVIISQCTVIQDTALNSCGDCIRIERTRGNSNIFSENYVFGGLSGIRTHLYCKNLKFYNNEVCNSWADVGITVAMSENLEIIGNYCHDHFAHGYEIDGVVNCTNNGNTAYKNSKSGFIVAEFGASAYANNPIFWGSIADGYGVDYSNQTYTSPKVPNINTVHMNNVSIENGDADRLIGLDTDVYAYNYAAHNNQTAGTGQLGVEGGTLNLTSVLVMNNTFKPNDGDDQAIYNSNYQFDTTVSGNRIIGNFKLMQYAGLGMWDANSANRFLQDSSNRSVLLSPVNDSASITGFALTHTTSGGPSTYPFTGIWCGGGGEKILRIVARASAPVTATVAVNLHLGAAYVATVLSTTNWNLTTEYTEIVRRIPSSASVGDNLRPQITLPDGNTIYIQELNVYQSVGD